MISHMCSELPLISITNNFKCPFKFLDALPSLELDVCILAIEMPKMDGLTVSHFLNDMPFIFITGKENMLKDALEANPIDILLKPIKKERLHKAIEKAYAMLTLHSKSKEYELFNVAEAKDKVNIFLNDIAFVRSNVKNPRNKDISLRNGARWTIMDCTFNQLLNLCSDLVQVNRTELVSLKIVQFVRHDLITIPDLMNNGKPCQVTLSDTCRKSFMDFLLSR